MAVHKHIKKPGSYLLKMVRKTFKDFLSRKYSLKHKKDYEFFITLTTYPKHWHIHACIYPFKDASR